MIDKDLLSIQETRALIRAAKAAQTEYALTSQEKVDALVCAVAAAIAENAQMLAEMAVEETNYGKVQDKKQKNLLASEKLCAVIKDMKTIGIIREDYANKITEIAVPVGVIAGIIPSTNPTSTTAYKSIIALKAGNAIVFTPHPSAKKCISKTVEIIQDVLRRQGFCPDLVSCINVPTIEGSSELMKRADLILATGGPAMVKAAYSSGTPALGVGAGNVPAYIERSANIEDAVRKIFESKTFDNGTICASEQSIIADRVIADQVKKTVIANGGYFLEGEKLEKVKRIMERADGSMNPAIVGRDALTIAKTAGIEVPPNTRILLSDEKGVGPKYPFSKEKLTALLGFYVVEDWQEACQLCISLLENCGIGHTLAMHSNDKAIVREFGLRKPVSRLLVNTPSTQGAVGFTTALFPSFTLGCGSVGGSATSDNVTPMHLLNIRRVAYDLNDNGSTCVSSSCVSSDCASSGYASSYASPSSYAKSACDAGTCSCCSKPNNNSNNSADVNAITDMIIAEIRKLL